MYLLPGNAVNRSAPLNRGLASWFMVLPNRFGGGGGNTYRDLQGRNHGTLTSSPTWSGNRPPGGYGSIYCTGGSHILFNNAAFLAAFTGASVWTVCWWEHAAAYGTNPASWAFDSAGDLLVMYSFDDSGGNGPRVYKDGNQINVDAGAPSVNTWHRYCLTNRSSTDHELYVDGVSLATNSGNWSIPTSLTSFAIGKDILAGQPSTSYHDGYRLFLRGFSASEAAQDYRASSRGYQNELNWQRYPVVDTQQAAGGFLPAWAYNQQSYIVGGGLT
jgi:hypothetical protein